MTTTNSFEVAREIAFLYEENIGSTLVCEDLAEKIAAALDAQAPKGVSEGDRDACLSYRIMKAALSTEDFDEAQEKVEALLAGRDQG